MNRAICFDLDGVLVDACEWHRISFNEALQHYTGSSISIEDHNNIYNGLPTVSKLSLLGITDDNLIKQINDKKQSITLNFIRTLKESPEKIELLKYLKQKNFLLACVTNSIRETAELMLEKTGQLNFFDCILTNKDVEKPKPNSEGYVQAMVKLQCLPKNTWIVEDSDKGLTAARNTGANVIKVNNATEVTLANLINYL